jgi:hypothetical protein
MMILFVANNKDVNRLDETISKGTNHPLDGEADRFFSHLNSSRKYGFELASKNSNPRR